MRANLESMFARADDIDIREGMLAYPRYHQVMSDLALLYGTPINRVTAAFCALSPNNDYAGNLRSVVSVLDGYRKGVEPSRITVSTYGHCKLRALDYVSGRVEFTQRAKGLKILSFYHNILRPHDNRFVTVDGHVCAAWRGKNLTMKEALIRSEREYREIADAIKALAFQQFILPNQYQAILWFARKRVLRIKYDAQLDLLIAEAWRTSQDVALIRPFEIAPPTPASQLPNTGVSAPLLQLP